MSRQLPFIDPQPDRAILAYGALGLPLAFAALPIYVHVPKLYVDHLGLPITAVGATLLVVRVLDGVTDPLIGWANDRWLARKRWVGFALPWLAIGMLALLAPPASAGLGWLAGALALVTFAWSAASIAYHAWGAELAVETHVRTRVSASREGFALVGVMLAAALPGMLADDEPAGLRALAWSFVPVLVLCALCTLSFGLRSPACAPSGPAAGVFTGLRAALAVRAFRRLLLVFAANGIAAAIPSVTVLFYVSDVLRAPAQSGLFLVLYFAAAAASLPLWVAIARRCGKRRAWAAAMVLAMTAFLWAATLGAGDLVAFALICIVSGAALGADLAVPPAMLADLLARDRAADGQVSAGASAGACFGWWAFVTKANLALAAGLALPLLGWLGYTPGTDAAGPLAALAMVYAVLPVVLKAGALALLLRAHDLEPEGGLSCRAG